MSKTMSWILMGVVGSVLLGGCEIILPLLAIDRATSSTSDPYAYDPYAYDPYGSYETLDVQVEDLSGQIGGVDLAPSMGTLGASGSHYGTSANFLLSATPPDSTGPADAGIGGGDGWVDPNDGVYVSLDVCPIDEYASGGPISDPAASFLNFRVCVNGDCRDSWDSDLVVDVADDDAGQRRVVVRGTWADGSAAALALRYRL